jgi:hypothetical protein
VLHSLNVPIIRFYEGYSWGESWIGQAMTSCQRRKFETARQLRGRAAKLRKEIRIFGITVDLPRTLDVQREMSRLLNDEFPDSASSVLPTRLGNVVRAFETYTRRQYGAGAIALWPRLLNVLDSDHAQAIDAVKTAFDFFINSSLLGGILALILTGAGFYWQRPIDSGFLHAWLAWDIILGGISWLAYVAAIGRAGEWGTQVMAAFDTNRRSLLDKLGYSELKPADLTEERRYWEIINQKLSFPDVPSPDLPYKIPPTSLIVEPVSAMVTWTRTVSPRDEKTILVNLTIANTGPLCVPADHVILREEIPDKQAYAPGSATLNGAPATLLSLNPLRIEIGALPYYESRTVAYTLKQQA